MAQTRCSGSACSVLWTRAFFRLSAARRHVDLLRVSSALCSSAVVVA
ncbi:putative leader peptide [Streptacidiphilus jiangxiensis]|uniref:Uncharacterized protein n=1 Tax=Streptacidiphilus jiangxiensis TaxID=235985 RepID=A0A1H7QX67_STRJI|nr:putative leader peptide [Streptacidiphilus jiangxiensis]SEL52318.1 hypothetical protein SAMN05414137_109256 [Streptacidiphilus jiangxiensis]